MFPYITIALLLSVISFIDLVQIDQFYKHSLFYFLTIVLALFLGTRMVGPDLWTYESFYNITPGLPGLLREFPKYILLTKFEPLFWYLIQFLGRQGPVFIFLIFVSQLHLSIYFVPGSTYIHVIGLLPLLCS